MSKIVLGYYTGWSEYNTPPFRIYDILNPTGLTHLLYAFISPTTTGALALLDPWADIQKPHTLHGDTSPLQKSYLGGNLHQLFRIKKNNRTIKTGISIGGYNNSTNFSSICASSTKRTTMANSIKTFVMNYGLDFIDIDWEYPAISDSVNFKLLLQKIKSVNPTIKIMVSFGANWATQIDITQIHPYVDYIQFMGVDFVGSTWGSTTGAHQNLYPQVTGETNSNTCLFGLINSGVPSDKLILECPMYARPSGQVSVVGNEIAYNKLQPYESLNNVTNTFRVSQETLDSNGVLLTYDSVNTITTKTNYINSQNLKGISFWELSSDRTNVSESLMNTATNLLSKDISLNNLTYPTSIYTNIKNPNLA